MNDNIVTSDLSDFGYRELAMARDLLTVYLENNNTLFIGDGVNIAMNRNSGYVFITDEDYNVAMECEGKLEDWFSSPYDGHEGFLEDLANEYENMHPEDQEWFNDIKAAYARS